MYPPVVFDYSDDVSNSHDHPMVGSSLPGCQVGCACSVKEPGEKVDVVSSAGKRTKPLRQFAFNELCGPIRDPVSNIEVHVMNFNVS